MVGEPDDFVCAHVALNNAAPHMYAALLAARKELRILNEDIGGTQRANTAIARVLAVVDAAIAQAEAA